MLVVHGTCGKMFDIEEESDLENHECDPKDIEEHERKRKDRREEFDRIMRR